MMQEGYTALFENSWKLGHICTHYTRVYMHQGVKAKDKINRIVCYHVERLSIINKVRNVVRTGKACFASLNTFVQKINGDEIVTRVLQVLSPSSKTTSDLQGCP